MYRLLLAIVFITLISVTVRFMNSKQWTFSHLIRVLIAEFTGFYQSMTTKIRPLWVLRKLMYSLTALFFSILVLSGFVPVLIFGEDLSGTFLIIHVMTAPAFVISFTMSLVLYAQTLQFNVNDWIYVSRQNPDKEMSLKRGLIFWKKVCFWLFTVFALPAILSVIISMYPLFGTDGQYFLLELHKCCVLFLFIIAAVYILLKWFSDKIIFK